MENYDLKQLTESEQKLIVNAPIFFALLGALHDNKISRTEEKDAKLLVHLRTFTSDPLLHDFYKESEINFKERLNNWEEELPSDTNEAKAFLEDKIEEVHALLKKMRPEFAKVFILSMQSFSKHVANSETHWWKVLPVFVNPFLDIPDLNK